jgi:O-antigen ligase
MGVAVVRWSARWRLALVVVTMALMAMGATGATNGFTWKGKVVADAIGATAYHKVPPNLN